jgi:hypothetical protein
MKTIISTELICKLATGNIINKIVYSDGYKELVNYVNGKPRMRYCATKVSMEKVITDSKQKAGLK